MRRAKGTTLVFHLYSHLIKSKADSVHVLAMAPVFAAVLLHESY